LRPRPTDERVELAVDTLKLYAPIGESTKAAARRRERDISSGILQIPAGSAAKIAFRGLLATVNKMSLLVTMIVAHSCLAAATTG
jgi:hypothetical protein